MNTSERLTAVENALESSASDEEIARDILKILLSDLKVGDVQVVLSDDGPCRTNITFELDGIQFKSRKFVYQSETMRMEVKDDYGPSIMKRRR